MTGKKQKVIYCPNCGKPTEAKDYYSLQGMAMGIQGTPDPVSSRIICSRCNYGGLPLEAMIEEYEKMDFSNWKMMSPPIQQLKPFYKFLMQVGVFIIFVLVVGGTFMFSPLLAFVVFILAAVWFWKRK